MAYTAGVFTPSAISAIILKERELLQNPRSMSELSKEVIAAQALLNHQDPIIIPEGAGKNVINAKISVLRSDSTDKGSKTVACDLAATNEAATETLTLTKEVLVNVEQFYVKDNLYNNAEDFASVWSYLAMKAKVNLEVKLAKAMVGVLVTNQDTPVATWFETDGTVNGSIYEIAEADFKADVLADIKWAARTSEMNMPLILNGRNFYNQALLAEFEHNGCCTNNKIFNSNKVFEYYWDAQNVDSVTSAKSTFAVDKNSLLFWSSPAYENFGMETMINEGAEAADRYHFVDTLPRLQYFANGRMNPIYVDFRLEKVCITDSIGVPRDAWHVEAYLYGALTANLANAAGYKGILRIDRVAGA